MGEEELGGGPTSPLNPEAEVSSEMDKLSNKEGVTRSKPASQQNDVKQYPVSHSVFQPQLMAC